MLKPLRLGISGSSFIYAMPQELRIAAYVTPVKKTPVKFDDRLNAMMIEFTREMMRTLNAVDPPCAMECYYSTAWDTDSVLEVVLDSPKVEFWSVHGPYGLHFDMSSPSESVRGNAVAAYCDAIELAARLGATTVVAHPGANEDYELSIAERLALSIEPFRRIADLAGEHGIRVAVEPLPKNEVGSRLEHVLEIIERVDKDNIGVNFDVNHMFPPEAIPNMITQAGSRIMSVHVSDQDGIERHWLPFEGTLDWEKILAALVDTGYTGPLIYESHVHDVETCDQVGKAIVENYDRLIRLAPALASESSPPKTPSPR